MKVLQTIGFVLISVFILCGCHYLTKEDLQSQPAENTPGILVKVNGTDVSQTCPVLYNGDTLYLSAVGVFQELGAVALERPAGLPAQEAQGQSYTLLAVTGNHTIQHVVETAEVLVDGQAITLDQPSILADGIVYVTASLLKEVLAAHVSSNVGDVTIEVTVPGDTQKLLSLNKQKEADYFCADRLFRYADYIMKYPELDAQKAVVYVNADLDKPFYTDIKPVADPTSLLVLCNKYNQLPKNYEPKDLKPMGNGYFLRGDAAAAYQEMIEAASQQGLSFQLKSAYRSYGTQVTLFNNSVARVGKSQGENVSARPGHSEHQTGLAVDVTQPTGDYGLSSANFEKTPQYAWISKHAHEFGFIQRYMDNKSTITGFVFEPWHYRFVGKEVARQIYEEGITFEEYMAMYRMSIDEG